MSKNFPSSASPFFSAVDGDNWNTRPGFRVILEFRNFRGCP